MRAETTSKAILDELKEIKTELHYIKMYMLDVDTLMSPDDILSLQEAERDLSEGKTKKLN